MANITHGRIILIQSYTIHISVKRAVLEVNPYAIQVYHRVCDSTDTTYSVYPRVEFMTAFAVYHEVIIRMVTIKTAAINW